MERYEIPPAPVKECNTIVDGRLRISLLTSNLIRVEYGAWTDCATQKVWRRDLGDVSFLHRVADKLHYISTEGRIFVVSPKGRLVCVWLGDKVVYNTRKGNLKGTARTLDNTLGRIPLGKGIVSRRGVSVMIDNSLLLVGGRVAQRGKGKDYYVFAYGHDYRGCMADYYKLCGKVPLVPKYALGNWWSRYKAYTQAEYMDVIQRFEDKHIPLTVATIDMDWHWTDVLQRFGKEAKPTPTDNAKDKLMSLVLPGWTGYSWNTELFPDHKQFLADLHSKGYHVTLNVHPSHGVRFFEDSYADMCQALGQDPALRKHIPFTLGDPKFVAAYFDVLHHPYEAEGVDFWWLDWQQGKKLDVPGLDPLWGLNHYHYLDSDRGDKRPLILSRFCGEGSHRYPLGFSGDTAINWPTLRFMPYFTATAANVGYTWWSHDIGGHHWFAKDDQLYLRWLQCGVFSPIDRLHSSANEFMGKEPWKCAPYIERIATEFLQLRHRMIPYLYSAAYRTHSQGIALCEPMYYGNDQTEAYRVPNQYRFGSQMIVVPVTCRVNKTSQLASCRVWLPEGEYTDWFSGHIYRGGQMLTMCRGLDSIPVLVPTGAIIPLYAQGESNLLSNDQPYEICLYHGDGSFELYEDDGESKAYQNGQYAVTTIRQQQQGDSIVLEVSVPQGDWGAVLPPKRRWVLHWKDVVEATAEVNGVLVEWNEEGLPVEFDTQNGVTVRLTHCVYRTNPDKKEQVIDRVSSYQMSHKRKTAKFGRLVKELDKPNGATRRLKGRRALIDPIKEILQQE